MMITLFIILVYIGYLREKNKLNRFHLMLMI